MGTENPDTERMHRLFDDALDDVDLGWDVVPGVLTGYAHKVKVRRCQAAGVALAVLATAGAAVGALPHGHGAAVVAPAASTPPHQGPDYCKHQHWVSNMGMILDTSSQSVAAYQADCEALQTALHAVFPDARLLPVYNADLTLDPRVDQALVKKVYGAQHSDPRTWEADEAKYFGPELKYLAVHPEDPANLYVPNQYEIVTAAGREGLGSGIASGKGVPKFPISMVGSAESNDCENMPASLKGTVRCTPVGIPGGWHGGLWSTPAGGVDQAKLTGVMTNGQGRNIQLWGDGDDWQAWYHQGRYDIGGASLAGDTWINRWTGQTYEGAAPPAGHALTEQQWIRFLDSPGIQKYADSYIANQAALPSPAGGSSQPTPSPAHSG